MKPLIIFFSTLLFLTSCASKQQKQYSADPQFITGEYLFEGPNTLQLENSISLDAMAESVGIQASQIQDIQVTRATVEKTALPDTLAESALLQVVSKNEPMISVGSVNPVPNGTTFDLQLAEEAALLPYFKDDEFFWVLDANFSSDQLDPIEIALKLEFNITYQ